MTRVSHEPRFDWEDAQQMYWDGRFTLREIADKHGVSIEAVRRVVIPGVAAKKRELLAAWKQRNKVECPGCGGPMSRQSGHNYVATKLCQACDTASKVTTVRESTLLCSACKQWLPDLEFSRDRGRASRRFRAHSCRACRAAAYRRGVAQSG